MKRNWNPSRKQRPRNNHVVNRSKINYLPYVHIKDGDKLMFFSNTDNYDLDMINSWVKVFSEAFPKVDCVVVPDDMFYAVPKLTGKEYTVINNILKKIKNKVV